MLLAASHGCHIIQLNISCRLFTKCYISILPAVARKWRGIILTHFSLPQAWSLFTVSSGQPSHCEQKYIPHSGKIITLKITAQPMKNVENVPREYRRLLLLGLSTEYVIYFKLQWNTSKEEQKWRVSQELAELMLMAKTNANHDISNIIFVDTIESTLCKYIHRIYIWFILVRVYF